MCDLSQADGEEARGPATERPPRVPGQLGRPAFFWLGVALITVGVSIHAADFVNARLAPAQAPAGASTATGYRMDTVMTVAVLVDVLGFVLAAWGLLPRRLRAEWSATDEAVEALDSSSDSATETALAPGTGLAAMDSARMTGTHWRLLGRLFLGLMLDTMKPALIGFVLPGLKAEYALTPTEVSLLPLFALTGTTVGSIVFGMLGDWIGRRSSFILTALLIASTSVCGLMPAFPWQLFTCFIMGLGAGGELPVIYTLLGETMPTKHRGWMSVVVGGIGGLSGFFAASFVAGLLEPTFTWRALFLTNLPTALLMVLLIKWVPESPRFLIHRGFHDEARKVMASVGVPVGVITALRLPSEPLGKRSAMDVFRGAMLSRTITLTLYGLAWGLCNWGFITWLPSMLRDLGQDAAFASRLLATSALCAIPGTLAAAVLYAYWSSKKTAALSALASSAVLVCFAVAQPVLAARSDLVALLVIGLLISSSSMLGVLAPYSVEVYPTALRGVGSGVVAASSKAGGIVAPSLVGALLMLAPGLAIPSLAVAVPLGLAGTLLAARGIETRGRSLESLTEPAPADGEVT